MRSRVINDFNIKKGAPMIVEELARNIVKTGFATLDNHTITQAKDRLIDIIGCTIGGANAPGCSELREVVREWGGKEEATVLIHGEKIPAHNAAMVNSIMARSFDYGVFTPYIGEKPIWVHNAESTVPTAITIADWKHLGGKELLTALILGDDITTRITAASIKAISPGWDNPGTSAKFGTTAVASKLLELGEHQIINAWGIVLNQLAGSFQPIQDGTHSFKLAQGLAARDGVIAAELAGKGWGGAKDPLLGRYGYFALYCQQHDLERLTADLGKKFWGDSIFKPYPSCRHIHSTIDCALKLVQNYDIKAKEIDKITLAVAPMHFDSPLNQPFNPGDFPQGHVTFSLRYHIANILIRKQIKLEHLTEKMIRDPEIAELAGKIDITGTIPPDKIETASLIIKTKDGREFSAYEDFAKGNPVEKPLSKQEIEAKFRDNVAFSKTISKRNAEKILDLLNNLEEVDDISRMVELLVA
jgi:2-methylcitrate dehydratase PrpD